MDRREFLKEVQDILKCMKDTICFPSEFAKALIVAIKKQIPLKPKIMFELEICPYCGGCQIHGFQYCPSCGQRIDRGG